MTDSNDENHRGRPRARTDSRRPASDRPVRARSTDKASGPDRGGDKPWASRNDDGPRKPRAAGAKPFHGKSFEDKPSRGKPSRGKPFQGKPSPGKPFQSRGSDERPRRPRPAEGERPYRARPEGDRSPRAGSPVTRASLPSPRSHDPDARPQRTEERPHRTEERANRVSAAEARVAAQASEPAEDRIAKVIARAGIASRRDVEVMIAAGRVTLNGTVLDSPAVNVTAADRITVDGEPLPARERTRLWLFNKPRGLVTTARDPEGRPTVFDNLPEDLPRVVAIGRLDINTEGLLLFTNDGGLARVIAHPDTGWLRRYRVRVHGEITQADLDGLRGGITVEGMEYGPVEAHLDRIQGDNAWITIGLREGKNREVKRILEHLGLQVNRLIRLSFGPFQLGDLEDGLVEEVRTRVLKDQLGEALAAEAGVDFESPVREPIAPFGSTKQRERAEPQHRERSGRPERGSGRERTFGRDRDEFPRRGPAHGRDDAEPERKRFSRLDPKVSVWRSGEDQAEPRRWVPRRGADPKEARTANAGRERQRVGAIQSEGRKVLVERIVSDPKDEPAPRREGRRAPAADDRPRRPRPSSERSFAGPMPDRRDDSRPARPRRDDGAPSRPRGAPDRARREGPDRSDGPKPFGGGAGRKPAGPGGKFAGSGGKGGPRTGFKGEAKGAPKGGSRGDFAGSGYKGKDAAGAGAKRNGPGGPRGAGFKAGGPKGSGQKGKRPENGGPGVDPEAAGRDGQAVRIVGGRWRGRPLKGPNSDAIRPTSDRLRETVFNILEHGYGDPITGARILDLFAGIGALGLEALSRGAAFALLVDDGTSARGLIRENIEQLGAGGVTRLFRRDATRMGPVGQIEPFSVVFCDPPYGRDLAPRALDSCARAGWLSLDALVIVEEAQGATVQLPHTFETVERREYGETTLLFSRHRA